MKKFLFIFAFLFAAMLLFAQTGSVEVSFNFTRQRGFSSNQFAVWVEDAQGRHVRTLYATRFTATGGWRRRELSLPLWVQQSNVAGMQQAQIDAVTGPTPGNGILTYIWDGNDSAGRALPAGEYRVFVEATLRNENRVLYAVAVQLAERGTGSSRTVIVQPQYFGSGTSERGMIGPVTVTSAE
jgi:hypothetical protein